MIGQKRAKRISKLALKSGANIILVAPSGHGKSMLAREVASVEYFDLESPYPPEQLLGLFDWDIPGKRIVCDEIHNCNKQDDWALFLDRFNGEVIFTTTDPNKLIEAIKTRSFILELDAYSLKDLAKISDVRGRNGKVIAILSRGIPRRAKNLGALFEEFGGSVTEFLSMMGVKREGRILLFPEEKAYLNCLENGAMGKVNLQRVLNLANFQEVELSLLRLGLIKVSHAGREKVY